MKYEQLKINLQNGKLKLPKFQREFVWNLDKSAALLDSILKGYPIGAFIFWETNEDLRTVRNLGNRDFPPTPAGAFVRYVLDGQQRLTSIYACFEGLKDVSRKGVAKLVDFSKIYIDLGADEDDDIVIANIKGREKADIVSITDLLGGYTAWEEAGCPKMQYAKMDDYKNRLTGYEYHVIPLENPSIVVAAEVFARMNVGGKPLSVFEIMVAKTYSDGEFDLSEEYDKLTGELEPHGYGKLDEQVVLIASAMIICGRGLKKDILAINRENFIAHWADVVKAIKLAIQYFQKEYCVEVLDILPYPQLVVPFAYFFHKHKRQPAGKAQRNLKDFFWMCSFSTRYMDALNSNLAKDIKAMDSVLDGHQSQLDWPVYYSVEYIDDIGTFNLGKKTHYVKAILCVLASLGPLSFKTNTPVALGDALAKSGARNYHHFFPKAYLRGGVSVKEINHIANITILDAETNQEIGARKPSEYMADFKANNRSIAKTMTTHLIGNFDEFGIDDDDYDKFFNARLQLISAEIQNRIAK